MMAEPITWLHLSDTHFQERNSWDAQIVRKSLLEDLKNRKQDGLKPDFVIFTGDITQVANSNEYQMAREFFDSLLDTVGLSKEYLFVVPGNHDVVWGKITRLLTAVRKNILEQPDETAFKTFLSELWDENRGAHRKILFHVFENYVNFVKDYLLHCAPNEDGFYVKTITLNKSKIALAGLNSSWMCGKDVGKGNILFCEKQVRKTVDSILSEKPDLKLVLFHHPLNWLHEYEQGVVSPLLEQNFNFILHGHLHRMGIKLERNPDATYIVIPAGAMYQGRNRPNTYNIVQLLDIHTLKGTIHLLRYSDERGGFWTDDNLTYQNVNGKYQFELAAREAPIKKPNIYIIEKTKVRVNRKDRSTLVWIEPGPFVMGSSHEEIVKHGWKVNESVHTECVPHEVMLNGYWTGKYPITNEQYARFLEETNYKKPNRWHDKRFNSPKQPVIGISWIDSEKYLEWAGLRFPTEAEWERAARGPRDTRRIFPWGDEPPDETYLNFLSTIGKTTPIDKYPKGATPDTEIMDMAGNVLEWCADSLRIYAPTEEKNPRGDNATVTRAIRGGSFKRNANECRATYRDARHINDDWGSTGLRPALS